MILMSTYNLKKRVTAIENKMKMHVPDEDFCLVLAIEALNENERGLIEEYRSLVCAGFDEEAIKSMMGEATFEAAVSAFKHLDEKFKRLMNPDERPVRPKRKGKPLKLPKEAGYVYPSTGSR